MLVAPTQRQTSESCDTCDTFSQCPPFAAPRLLVCSIVSFRFDSVRSGSVRGIISPGGRGQPRRGGRGGKRAAGSDAAAGTSPAAKARKTSHPNKKAKPGEAKVLGSPSKGGGAKAVLLVPRYTVVLATGELAQEAQLPAKTTKSRRTT